MKGSKRRNDISIYTKSIFGGEVKISWIIIGGVVIVKCDYLTDW